jgi:fermentation-respiration switch protein FrsA (DUF1100 family)
MARLLIGVVVLAAAAYLAVAVLLFVIQRRLIYPIDPTYHNPAEADLENTVREVRLTTPDGVTLIAWQASAAPGKPTLLYFHGNGGGLIDRAERIKRFTREGYGLFMPAYRGYAGSGGAPSETALVADARLAYDHLIAEGLRPDQIAVYGESLGTGVAVQLAASRQVAAVVLDAPYTELAAIGQQLYPFLPVKLFLKDKFASIEHIGRVKAPILILHGSRDGTIPPRLGQALYEAAPSPKEIHIIEGAGHSDIYAFGAIQPLRSFLDKYLHLMPERAEVSR